MIPDRWLSAEYQPVMGTVLQLQLLAAPTALAAAERAVLETIERLTKVFSSHDEESELRRWQRGEATAGPELTEVLAAAQHWFVVSKGAFNPAAAALSSRWRRAQQEQQLPAVSELAELASQCQQLPYEVAGQQVSQLAACATVDLYALSKGYIVDRAAEAGAAVPGVAGIVVNAGGDLKHLGAGDSNVNVEDPRSGNDNAPALHQIRLVNQAVASSGSARRGFRVAGRWFGHVLDPITGWPVSEPAGVTVVAPTALAADVLATVIGVGGSPVGLPAADLAEAGWLQVSGDGSQLVGGAWPRLSEG